MKHNGRGQPYSLISHICKNQDILWYEILISNIRFNPQLKRCRISHNNELVKHLTVKKWCHYFKLDGRSCEDAYRWVCPKSVITDENVNKTISNRTVTMHRISEVTGISYGPVRRIIVSISEMTMSPRWVPEYWQLPRNENVTSSVPLLTRIEKHGSPDSKKFKV